MANNCASCRQLVAAMGGRVVFGLTAGSLAGVSVSVSLLHTHLLLDCLMRNCLEIPTRSDHVLSLPQGKK